MKKLMLGIIIIMSFALSMYAYDVGGAYARLINCNWGQYGYEYGYIGTYDVNGKIYQIYFGPNYCQY
ncbi:hypothetical protein [Aliarcobacter butzleri]|uniref:hypothetical protein n=1 Tax=Aliarcobacter butzleri TaxID=28197 RepID=UPI002B249418|nr:hypothetical protein [Aliarcobacter butzleri]